MLKKKVKTVKFSVAMLTAALAAGMFGSVPVSAAYAKEQISTIEVRNRDIVMTIGPEETSGMAALSGITEYINSHYDNLGLADVDNTLNIRSKPVNGKIIGKLLPDGAFEIEETTDEGWYKITSGDIEGYVSADYVLAGEQAYTRAEEIIQVSVVVNVSGLNLRKAATTTSKVIKVLPRNSVADVIEDNGEWLKVSFDGKEGYVYGEHVMVRYNLPAALTIDEYNASKKKTSSGKSASTAASKALPASETVSDLRTRLVAYAKQFVGYPYVYGGNSLTKGTDCSGFVKLIMAEFGITTPRTASTQYNAGKKISVSELLPGDLIVYGDKVIEHIGIYIGNGQIVHASNKKSGIKYSKYNYRNIYGCVRFIED